MNEQTHAIASALAAPFDPAEIRWKPQAVSGNRALAVAYVNARVVMDRLDETLGVDGWQDRYQLLPDGSAVCQLPCRIEERWIVKSDVGSPSEQPDEGDRHKAAFSDALKRAAVKFGVGRYLYSLPKVWTDYDPQKKQFTKTPQLPTSASPASAAPSPSPAPSVGFSARLQAFDAELARRGLCRAGECFCRVQQGAVKAGLPDDMRTWNESQQKVALSLARTFEAQHKAKGAKHP